MYIRIKLLKGTASLVVMDTNPSESSSDASEVVPGIKRPLPEDSPQLIKQSKNKKTKTGECICTICQDPIVDPSETTKGQDLIFCEVQCLAWIHR